MLVIILDILNLIFIVAIAAAFFYMHNRQSKRIAALEKELAHRGEVLDHSSCYRATAVKLADTKGDPESFLDTLKQFMGSKVKISMTNLDIKNPDFPEQLKTLPKDVLIELLDTLKEQEEFRGANVVQLELEKRVEE